MSEAAVARASALLDVGRPDEAASVLVAALAGDPSNGEGWCLLASAHLERGQRAEALDCARRAIALHPDEEWPHRIASIASLRRMRSRESAREARECVRLAPGLAVAHAQLAEALSHGGVLCWREAARAAERAIGLAPDDALIHVMAGNVALRQRRRRLAERRFARALEIDPSHSTALNNLSVVRLRRGLTLTAASGFVQAAALNPASDLPRRNLDAAVHYLLGYAAILLGGVAVVTAFDPIAGLAALVLVACAGMLYARRARRIIGPAAWNYAMSGPLQSGLGLFVALQFGLVFLAGVGRSPGFAVMPFFFGVRMFVQMGFRRITR